MPKKPTLFLLLPFLLAISCAQSQDKVYTYPLYGNVTELLYYYANIYVGSPPQQQSVIVDTGSSFVGVPCEQSCRGNCGKVHRNTLFNAEVSNTFAEESCSGHKISSCDCRQGKCNYHQSYAEGSSYSGYYVSDLLGFSEGEETKVRYYFGCHSSETHLFATQLANGIFGLANKGQPVRPYVDFLYENKKIDDRVFSLCLGRNGGYITFGGHNESLIHGNSTIQYSSMNVHNNYELPLKSLTVNGKKIPMEHYRTIIDSGASYTQLPLSVEKELVNEIERYCKAGEDRCKGRRTSGSDYCYIMHNSVKNTKEFFLSFPDIYLQIGDERIPWSPSDYLVVDVNDPTKYCLGVEHQVPYTILGMTFMRQKQVVFNLDTRRIGFVPADCSHDHNEVLLPVPEKNETFPEQPEKVPMPLNYYKLIAMAGALGVVILLGILIICVKRCMKRGNIGVRQYANLEVKNPPDTIVVMHNQSVRSVPPVANMEEVVRVAE